MKTLLVAVFFAITLAAAGDMKSLKAGDTAPSFKLKSFDGKEYNLPDLVKENKYAVVMFIATRCPVSNAYNERMVALHKDFSSKGVGFIAINSNKAEDMKEVEDHSKEHKFSFPVVKDPNNVVADTYGAEVTPEIFVINKDLKLLYHGRIDDSKKADEVKKKDLADALTAILSGKEAPKDQPKAFGCSIKRVEKSQP